MFHQVVVVIGIDRMHSELPGLVMHPEKEGKTLLLPLGFPLGFLDTLHFLGCGRLLLHESQHVEGRVQVGMVSDDGLFFLE